MKKIRLFNLALLFVCGLFVQTSVAQEGHLSRLLWHDFGTYVYILQ